MELNDVKNYLNQANYFELRINTKLEQLDSLHHLMLRLGGSDRTAARIAALQEEIDRDIAELVERRNEITRLIRRLPKPEHQNVLELRYLRGWDWKRIAMNMHFTEDHVFRLHREALKIILNSYEAAS